MSAYVDGRGLGFREADRILRHVCGRAAEFPQVKRQANYDNCHAYRGWFDHCQACGADLSAFIGDGQLHHIFGGMKGRADEVCNLLYLCRDCHMVYQSSIHLLPTVLWIKWRTDQRHTDWCRLALIRGCFLPEPRADRSLLNQYLWRRARQSVHGRFKPSR